MNKPSEPGWYLCDCGGKPGYIQGDLAMYFDGKNVLTSPMGPRCLLPMTNFRRLVVAEEGDLHAEIERLRQQLRQANARAEVLENVIVLDAIQNGKFP